MPKRGRDTLTGGTHDVNPQFINIPITFTDSTTTGTLTTFVLPKSPITQNGRAQIIEILKIWFKLGTGSPTDTSQDMSLSVLSAAPSAPTTVESRLSDSRVIAKAIYSLRADATATQSWALAESPGRIQCVDLTDGAGHGVLVATDNLYVQAWVGAAAVGVTTADVKCLFRYKNVGVQEYIGIVQGQS